MSNLNAAPFLARIAEPSRATGRAGLVQQISRLIEHPMARSAARIKIWSASTDREAHDIAIAALEEEGVRIERELAPLRHEGAYLKRLADAGEDVMSWLQQPAPWSLEAVSESLFHKVTAENTTMFVTKPHPLPPEIRAAQEGALGVFLVQHDWAALMEGADVDGGDYRLPFDFCCFEVQIKDRRICVLVASDGGEPYRLIPIIRARGGWIIMRSLKVAAGALEAEGLEPREPINELEERLAAQVRAIAITLDAEVVVSEVVRAPEAMNAKRLRRNERPIFDHHVLHLNRRPRALPPSTHETGSRKRLHFRRGHWRRYPQHKTWIRWCLVGDPALGFADKDYRL